MQKSLNSFKAGPGVSQFGHLEVLMRMHSAQSSRFWHPSHAFVHLCNCLGFLNFFFYQYFPAQVKFAVVLKQFLLEWRHKKTNCTEIFGNYLTVFTSHFWFLPRQQILRKTPELMELRSRKIHWNSVCWSSTCSGSWISPGFHKD